MSDESTGAIDQLHRLLEQQLVLVHQGHLAAAESLCEQTGRLVTTVVATGLLAGPGGDERRRCLLRRYQELSLMLTAQRQETYASLRAIRRGTRTLRVYRRSAP
ncbi:MAG: hypothetical protein JW955_01475 [Sedimentisphaerales bacterium]|nr:hypothetical protein [Sedimentisphaerales bacterium]